MTCVKITNEKNKTKQTNEANFYVAKFCQLKVAF